MRGKPAARKRFLRTYKNGAAAPAPRKVLAVQEMADFIGGVLDTGDRAMAMLFAKEGVRRGELVAVDRGDINWERGSLLFKPRPKRTNRRVFFDEEAVVDLAPRQGTATSSRSAAARRRKAR